MTNPGKLHLAYSELSEAFVNNSLFKNKTWKLSPDPWTLSYDQVKIINHLGSAALEFYHAIEYLYVNSKLNSSILRSRELLTPWVADYFDRGKPLYLIAHALNGLFKNSVPPIIRPDLIVTENGFALTEFDAVPGGVGLTAFLYELYEKNTQLIGSVEKILSYFYSSLTSLTPEIKNPTIAIIVSDEADVYRPEYNWLAKKFFSSGQTIFCIHPSDVFEKEKKLYFKNNNKELKIDILYRFFELFDLKNIPNAEIFINAAQAASVVVTPPMKFFQEEKLSFAFFHHYLLEDFWKENLSNESYSLLKKIIPLTWILDPGASGSNAIINGPLIKGKPLSKWEDFARASQRERNYIIKISGFHETAWGSRSITFGSDVSQAKWAENLKFALNSCNTHPYIVQAYHKPILLKHRIYKSAHDIEEQNGRVRLSPFYFTSSNHLQLGGILATFCPADKKIIHGMQDAAMLPC